MIILDFLIIASVWQMVFAESNVCSSSVVISNQSDANKLNSCDTFEGSVRISAAASGVITINNLEEIKGALMVEESSKVTEIVAPELETVQGAITLRNLNSLTTITMGALSQVSSMVITGNPKLKSLGFQELEEVGGQLELRGAFDSVSLPSLNQVNGRTTIRGSSAMSCRTLDSLKPDVFKGGYSCSEGSSGLSPGAKGGIAAGVIIGVILTVVILWLLLRQRRQKKRALVAQPTVQSSSTSAPVMANEEKTPVSTRSVSPQSVSVPNEPQNNLPRKPVGSAIFLDGRSIYEAPNGATPIQEYHELDAGPVLSSHQRPIHAA